MTPQELVERGLALLGSDRGTIRVEQVTSANLRWANSSLTTNGLMEGQQVHVAVHPTLDGGLGAGSAGAVVGTVDELAGLVERARSAALGSGPAPDAADPIPARPASPDWDDPPVGTDPGALAAVSALLGEVLGDPSISYYGYAEHSVATTYLGTTAGLRLRHVQPAARFELCGKSAGRTRSAWAGRAGRDLAAVDLASAPDEVRRGLEAQAHRVEVGPGRQRVVLSPSAAADLLIYLLWSAGARDAAEGRSAFARPEGGVRVGERLSGEPFWLRSDPVALGLECPDHVQDTASSALGSAFDAGMPLAATDWIAEGHLRALVGSRHAASLAGLPPTPFVDNLLAGVAGRSGSLDDLATRVGDGLLVTCLWYIREVDATSLLLTGLTRDGVYVVRDGTIVGTCGNFRFNESPVAMLDRIVDAGDPVPCLPREWADWFTRAEVAPLAIDGFNLSTPSEAV
ncbi:MAG: metallopeptidase TldD-related protein [Candidatus Nanopelagicales bacterium]|nr:metallopeptidase TldD-related protein [Candidatus Nanopelagicales bacterium]